MTPDTCGDEEAASLPPRPVPVRGPVLSSRLSQRPSLHLHLRRPLASGDPQLHLAWVSCPPALCLWVCCPGTALLWGQHMLLLSRQRKVQGLPVWRNREAVPTGRTAAEEVGQQRRGRPGRHCLGLRGARDTCLQLGEGRSLTANYCFRMVGGGVFNHQLSICWAFVFI